jgi:hypothetical protein
MKQAQRAVVRKQQHMLHGTRAKRRFILSVIVPADGTSAATV